MRKLSNHKHTGLIVMLIIVATFLLFWAGLFTYKYFFSSKTFGSNSYYLNQDLSGQSVLQAKDHLSSNLNDIEIIIKANDYSYSAKANDLGVYVNEATLAKAYQQQRLYNSLLPFSNKSLIGNFLAIDDWLFKNNVQNNLPNPDAPLNARYTLLANNEISISEQKSGKSIDFNKTNQELLDKFNTNQEISIESDLINAEPLISSSLLQSKLSDVQQILKNSYGIKNKDIIYNINKTQLVNELSVKCQNEATNCQLFLPISSANKLVVATTSEANISPTDQVTTTYKSGKPDKITQDGKIGKYISNIPDLAAKLSSNIMAKLTYSEDLVLVDKAFESKVIALDDTNIKAINKYKIVSWGNITSDLNDFAKKVEQTLADGRGWARANVGFEQVDDGSTLEIVLSEASQLPARYPGVCDAIYSCRVGKYVIINEDRWLNATPVWTGNLRDYQNLVVNHEAGHWLGLDHPGCPATGQPAPVMMQQSIYLGGCTFNPWPLGAEIISLTQ